MTMKNPDFKVTVTATGQTVNALVGPVDSEVGLSATFFADPPSGGVQRYDWHAVPFYCVDLGEPLTDPDFKRVVTLKGKGHLVVVAYDDNGFALHSQVVQVTPSA